MLARENGAVCAIAPSQIRAARGLLAWSQDQLVAASRVPKRTLVRLELGQGEPQQRTVAAVRAALEQAGVDFTNGGSPGVRLAWGRPTVRASDDVGIRMDIPFCIGGSDPLEEGEVSLPFLLPIGVLNQVCLPAERACWIQQHLRGLGEAARTVARSLEAHAKLGEHRRRSQPITLTAGDLAELLAEFLKGKQKP